MPPIMCSLLSFLIKSPNPYTLINHQLAASCQSLINHPNKNCGPMHLVPCCTTLYTPTPMVCITTSCRVGEVSRCRSIYESCTPHTHTHLCNCSSVTPLPSCPRYHEHAHMQARFDLIPPRRPPTCDDMPWWLLDWSMP